ncbi:hypothetical protein [Pueribacillus theae]|nr:hypothetical protein [Pueribacillus theae]
MKLLIRQVLCCFHELNTSVVGQWINRKTYNERLEKVEKNNRQEKKEIN